MYLILAQAVDGVAAVVALVLLEHEASKTVKSLNPFDAPGSLQAERQRIRRERFKFVVWTVVGANVLLLAGLLIQGCQREPATSGSPEGSAAEAPPSETNAPAIAQAAPETNAPVTPSFVAPGTNTAPEPAVASVTPGPAQTGTKPYVVVKGDSFYKIAKANGVSMKALAEANPGVDSGKLKVGQALQLPAGAEPAIASSTNSPARASATASSSPSRYVVKAGDTLDRIARTHGTTVRAIKAANGLTSDRIIAGRSLKLPASKASGIPAAQG
jgi:LysM repeat protein